MKDAQMEISGGHQEYEVKKADDSLQNSSEIQNKELNLNHIIPEFKAPLYLSILSIINSRRVSSVSHAHHLPCILLLTKFLTIRYKTNQ